MAGMQIQLRGRDKRGITRYKPLAEINVTPFVDVMLVLLIVFMVAAPLLQVGVPVDLPRADAQKLPEDNTPLTISVDQTGAIFIEDTEISLNELIPRLEAIAETRQGTDTRLYLRGDRQLDYGQVMQVMSAINKAGFTKVALVADKPDRS